MTRYRLMLYILSGCLPIGALLLGYYLWQCYYVRPFSCEVNFVQHHSDETLQLWLNYRMDGTRGMLMMNGRVRGKVNKRINRKISFRVASKGNVFYLTSEHNMKFPDDQVEDSWLEKYEPLFFVYPQKSIYMQINAQQNGNYLFILESLPTYVCRSITRRH
ncbi:hypothetical protein ACI2JR_16290 [Klebsiella sp. NPDC088457]